MVETFYRDGEYFMNYSAHKKVILIFIEISIFQRYKITIINQSSLSNYLNKLSLKITIQSTYYIIPIFVSSTAIFKKKVYNIVYI